MIRVGGAPAMGAAGEDVEFCGLIYPDGDEISKHMAARLSEEPFYQHDKFAQAMECVRFKGTAIDCGAWVGGWTRALADQFTFVLSIEANPDNARCVRKNVGTRGNVFLVNAALGAKAGLVTVEPEANGPNVGSRVVYGGHDANIPMVRLDDLPEVAALGGVDYIKLHVNGMEFQALLGAEKTLRKHRPVLTIVLKPAITNYGDSAEKARLHLRGLGYHRIGGESPYEIWGPN